jgi:hypothetical protein
MKRKQKEALCPLSKQRVLYCVFYTVCAVLSALWCVVCTYLDAHLKGGKRLFLSFSNTMTSPSFSVATSLCATRVDPLLWGRGEGDRRRWEREEKMEMSLRIHEGSRSCSSE